MKMPSKHLSRKEKTWSTGSVPSWTARQSAGRSWRSDYYRCGAGELLHHLNANFRQTLPEGYSDDGYMFTGGFIHGSGNAVGLFYAFVHASATETSHWYYKEENEHKRSSRVLMMTFSCDPKTGVITPDANNGRQEGSSKDGFIGTAAEGKWAYLDDEKHAISVSITIDAGYNVKVTTSNDTEIEVNVNVGVEGKKGKGGVGGSVKKTFGETIEVDGGKSRGPATASYTMKCSCVGA